MIRCFLFISLCFFSNVLYAKQAPTGHNSKLCTRVYRVKLNDTLHHIARKYHISYRLLAHTNHLRAPYTLSVGQHLHLPCHSSSQSNNHHQISTKPKQSLKPKKTHHHTLSCHWFHHICWIWPTKGKIVETTTLVLAKKQGIAIAGNFHQPVFASADGTVVYADNNLPGYSHLIIIRHNHRFVTAYAYNDHLFVRKDQHVTAGQKIAQMGRESGGKVLLYFEIRYNGRPVNPLYYLPKSKQHS